VLATGLATLPVHCVLQVSLLTSCLRALNDLYLYNFLSILHSLGRSLPPLSAPISGLAGRRLLATFFTSSVCAHEVKHSVTITPPLSLELGSPPAVTSHSPYIHEQHVVQKSSGVGIDATV